jgi:hypothetical protein
MILNKKTLEKLQVLINEGTIYRSGPVLVDFFNDLGFNDTYEKGFPSRWFYTAQKLEKINGTPELDKCIKMTFQPINFVGRIDDLDNMIKDFNQYLTFDKWEVIRIDEVISFRKLEKVKIEKSKKSDIKENQFLEIEFDEVPIEKIGLDSTITNILKSRSDEVKKCISSNAPLAVIFHCGGMLEGILLGVASKYPSRFNQTKSAPKDKQGKTLQYHCWSLKDYIDSAYELGIIKEDVKKFSHSLRDFRNYIHPYQQVSSNFNPDFHTARISWQVLKAAIYQITNYIN